MIARKKIARFSASVLLLSALLLTTAMASGGVAVVTADALRLRAEPDMDAPVLALVYRGAEVSVLSEELDGWYQVLWRDQKGFMSAQYLEFQNKGLLAYVNTGGDKLNLRSGPGTTYEILGKAGGGSVLRVLDEDAGWYQVDYEGQAAYVSADFVRLMTQDEYDQLKAGASGRGAEIAAYAQSFLGCSYVYGGNGPTAFDCSGFVKYIYGQHGITLNRTATDQLQNGVSVEKSELAPGDLVFFNNGSTSKPVSHVGLYIGGGDFIHASTQSKGVRIDNLDSGHYDKVYVFARRIV